MSLRHARITMALSLLLISLAATANAAVLWDQSAISFSTSAPAIANGKFTGFGGYTFYSVNDVTVPAAGWTIQTITSYWSDWTGVNMNVKAPTGNLIVMPKSGALPSGAPTVTTIPLTWVDTVQSGQGVYVMTAAGLNVVLPAGDYWITVSPITPVDNFNGNNAMWPALNYSGAPVATWDGTAWSDQYGSYDQAIKIEGTDGGVTPTHNASWGGLKALYR